jgi:hypothetical protein
MNLKGANEFHYNKYVTVLVVLLIFALKKMLRYFAFSTIYIHNFIYHCAHVRTVLI